MNFSTPWKNNKPKQKREKMNTVPKEDFQEIYEERLKLFLERAQNPLFQEEDKEARLECEDFLNFIESSPYSPNYQKKLISEVRKDVKKIDMKHIFLYYFKGSEDFYKQFQKEKEERIKYQLSHKVLVSYQDYMIYLDTFLHSQNPYMQALGLFLATGRRYSELKLENFSEGNNDYSLTFRGQLKTQGGFSYLIPTLAPAKEILRILESVESKINLSPKLGEDSHADYLKMRAYSKNLLGYGIHHLRSLYNVLILYKEGYLSPASLVEPTLRSKEILGHAWESDATEAYKKYALSEERTEEGKQKERFFKIYDKATSATKVSFPHKEEITAKDFLERFKEENPDMILLDKKILTAWARVEYYNATGREQIASLTFNAFLYSLNKKEAGINFKTGKKDKMLESALTFSPFSTETKEGIYKLWSYFKISPKEVTEERIQEFLGESLNKQEKENLLNLFEKIKTV